MLKHTTFNTFYKKTQLAPALLIINRKPEYEISQMVDFKIDYQWACKLFHKVIWLEYENTKDESK